jgi:hypothetical protein
MRKQIGSILVLVTVGTGSLHAQIRPAAELGPTWFASRSDAGPVVAPALQEVVPLGAYLSAGVIAAEGELPIVAELVEVVSPTVVPRTRDPQIQPYDRVYARLNAGVSVGDRLHLMRRTRWVSPYGWLYVPTGEARVTEVVAGTATLEVDRFHGRVDLGDVAVSFPAYRPRVNVAPVPVGGLEGLLLALEEPQPLVSVEDVAFVNLGTASGVVEGDEYEVYIPASAAPWGVRPEEVVGRVQVVRAERLTSAVRVISLRHPALEPGLPVRLVARMPS